MKMRLRAFAARTAIDGGNVRIRSVEAEVELLDSTGPGAGRVGAEAAADCVAGNCSTLPVLESLVEEGGADLLAIPFRPALAVHFGLPPAPYGRL